MPVHDEMLELKIDTKSIAEANKLNRNKHKGRLRTGAAWEGMVALLAEVEETATEQIGVLAETAAAKKAAAAEAKKAEETRKRKMDEEAVSKKKPASGTANRKTPASEVSEAAAEKVAEEAAFTQALSLFSPEIPPSEMENLPRIVEEDSAASAKTKRTNLLAIVKRLRQEAKVTTAREQEQLVGERERLAREQERLARERERLAEVTAFRKTRASVTAEMIAARETLTKRRLDSERECHGLPSCRIQRPQLVLRIELVVLQNAEPLRPFRLVLGRKERGEPGEVDRSSNRRPVVVGSGGHTMIVEV